MFSRFRIGNQVVHPEISYIDAPEIMTSTNQPISFDVTISDTIELSNVTSIELPYVRVLDSDDKTIKVSGNKLLSASLPNLELIKYHACRDMFSGCTSLATVNLSNLKEIVGENGCTSMFERCTGLATIDLSNLITILDGYQACYQMFFGCTGLTSVDLSNLTTIAGREICYEMFYNCTSLSTIDLSSLTEISGGQYNGEEACSWMFYGCTSLASANLSSLESIFTLGCYHMFDKCSSLTTVDLSSLATIYAQGCESMFEDCTSLKTLYFPALNSHSFDHDVTETAFSNMLNGCTGVTVHFPSNLQSIIGDWYDVTHGFGGTNTTVLFDLPATN